MSSESTTENEPPNSEALPELNLEAADAARHTGARMQERAVELNRTLASPAVKQAAESVRRLSGTFAVTPMMKALADSVKLPDTTAFSLGEIGKSLERLRLASVMPMPRLQIPEFNATLAKLGPRPEVVTVQVLNQMHTELEGMAVVLAESARQQAVLIEVTQANVTATQALIVESQKSRSSARRWALGLFVVGTIAAIAVISAFDQQILSWWSWLRSVV